MSEVELICDDRNLCGEGPLWDYVNQRLIWNDCSSSLLYEYTPGNRRRVLNRGLMIACESLNIDGRLVVAGAEGLCLWTNQDQVVVLIREYASEQLNFNDMIASPAGGIYAGTCYWDGSAMTRTGTLYHIAPDGSVAIVDDGFLLANGLGFSPDGRTLYFTDSAARTIYAYDVASGRPDLTRKRVFVRVSSDEGIPDGLTVDSAGFVYSAQWYGGQVVRYDPQGRVERRILMPVKQVSSVALGGKDLCELFITSAADPWPSPLAPPSYEAVTPNVGGGLYRVRTDTPGLHEHLARLA